MRGLQKAQQTSTEDFELVADSYLQFKRSVIDQTIVSSPLTAVLSTLREIPKNKE